MKDFLSKYSRFWYGGMILCFFLPFFNVSCEGMTVASVSGFDMVVGGELDGLVADMSAKDLEESGVKGDLTVDREVWAIVALGILLVGVGLGFVKNDALIKLHILISVATFVALIMLHSKITDSSLAKDMGGSDPDLKVEVGAGLGFGLVALSCLTLAVCTVVALRNSKLELPPPPTARVISE